MHPLIEALQQLEAKRTDKLDIELEVNISSVKERLRYVLNIAAKKRPKTSRRCIAPMTGKHAHKKKPVESIEVDTDGLDLVTMLRIR